tara:strand:- start:16275 stop:16601 length:327 start_codon:yes stop_codon:yes gene_type:complete
MKNLTWEINELNKPLSQNTTPKFEKVFTKAICALEEVQKEIRQLYLEEKISIPQFQETVMQDSEKLINNTVDLVIKTRELIEEKNNGYNNNTIRLERKKETSDSRACS